MTDATNHDDDRHAGCMSVSSNFNWDGTANYVVTVSAGPDIALSLKAAAAVRYVATVVRAGVIAQHDAAVMKQLLARDLDIGTAASTIVDLRADREPLNTAATVPLRYAPIVAAHTFLPFVHVFAGKTQVTQWSPEECFQHAGHVMQALAGVDLDAAYYRYLMHTCGCDAKTSRAAVFDLSSYATGLTNHPGKQAEP